MIRIKMGRFVVPSRAGWGSSSGLGQVVRWGCSGVDRPVRPSAMRGFPGTVGKVCSNGPGIVMIREIGTGRGITRMAGVIDLKSGERFGEDEFGRGL